MISELQRGLHLPTPRIEGRCQLDIACGERADYDNAEQLNGDLDLSMALPMSIDTASLPSS